MICDYDGDERNIYSQVWYKDGEVIIAWRPRAFPPIKKFRQNVQV